MSIIQGNWNTYFYLPRYICSTEPRCEVNHIGAGKGDTEIRPWYGVHWEMGFPEGWQDITGVIGWAGVKGDERGNRGGAPSHY